MARWTGVVPVDGAFSVVTNYFANPVSGGTVVTSSYPPSALMLAEEGPSGLRPGRAHRRHRDRRQCLG